MGNEVAPSRTYAITGLRAGQKYDLRVTAHNAAGSQPAIYKISTPIAGGTG